MSLIKINCECIQYLCESDATLKRLIYLIGDMEFTQSKNYFESLVLSIIGQQLSSKAASTISKRVQCLCNGEIIPMNILSLSQDELRTAGVSRAKIEYLKDLATKVLEKRLDFSYISNLSNEEVVKNLMSVKGIGRWTAEMFLIFALGRTDVMSYADVGLQRATKWLYNLPDHPQLKYLQQVDHLWSPFQSIVSLYLWEAIDRGFVDSGKSILDLVNITK